MKILVVSLLRLGDVILCAPALKGLRDRYPQAEIHVLINKQFAQVSELLPFIDKFIYFDRKSIQTGLGDAQVPMFESYERLTELVDELNSFHYDLAINFTHTKLSGWLLSLVDSRQKQGLWFDEGGRAHFGSNWFRYLNSQVAADGRDVFHFSDVFRFALDLQNKTSLKSCLIESDAGRAEAGEYLATIKSSAVIAVQVLTSDTKKDWGFAKFTQCLKQIAQREPNAHFAIMGAPFERESLEGFVETLKNHGVSASLAITSFAGAYSLLRQVQLLITGDTSIKHLACVAGTRVLEISLGSSDFYRTGAYSNGSVILQAKEACSPCVHSNSCFRETHACATRISSDIVAGVATELLQGRHFQIKAIAEEYQDEVEVYMTNSKLSSYWAVHSVLEPFTEESIARWVDLSCRKIWLNGDSGRISDRRGTEILELSQFLKSIHSHISEIEWRHFLGDFESQVASVDARINGLKAGIKYLHGCYEDPKQMRVFVKSLIGFREKLKSHAILRSFRASLDHVIEDDISPPFVRFRRIVDAVDEIEQRAAIHLKILRALGPQLDQSYGVERL